MVDAGGDGKHGMHFTWPKGTPLVTLATSKASVKPSQTTCCLRLDKKDSIQLIASPVIYCACTFKMADRGIQNELETVVKSNRLLESFRNESCGKSLDMYSVRLS